MSNEETTSSTETDVIEFPTIRLNLEDEVFYHCKACDHKITESMEKDEKDEVLRKFLKKKINVYLNFVSISVFIRLLYL